MENQAKNKNHGWVYFLVFAVLILIFIIVGWGYILKPQATNNTGSSNQNQQDASGNRQTPDIKNQNDQVKKDNDFYDSALKSLQEKDFAAAIENFDQAIAVNPYNAAYFSGKSEALLNLNQKDEAKATLEKGINFNPTDQLLRSKLDVLNKDFLAPAKQDNPRL